MLISRSNYAIYQIVSKYVWTAVNGMERRALGEYYPC